MHNHTQTDKQITSLNGLRRVQRSLR